MVVESDDQYVTHFSSC